MTTKMTGFKYDYGETVSKLNKLVQEHCNSFI